MNTSNIKTQILILQVIDWALLIGVLGGGLYATLNWENRFLAAVLSIIGLGIVNMFGQWSLTKIAIHRQELKQLEKTQHQ
jgi:hypothetical protein